MPERKSPKKSPSKNLKTSNDILKMTRGSQEGFQEGFTDDMTHSQILSEISTKSVGNAYVVRKFALGNPDEVDITDTVKAMSKAAKEVADGNLNRVEAMLVSQAISLDAMFQNLAMRASNAEYIKNLEAFMRLALKAQSQCRTTIEAIGLLKNPGTYIRQANIAQGHQQVNNTYATTSGHTVAQKSKVEPSRLIGEKRHERMDTRAQSQAVASHQGLEAVGAVDRP